MRLVLIMVLLGFILLTNACFAKDNCNNDKIIAGYVEQITLPKHLNIEAKLDTGADKSSLNARNIKVFIRNGAAIISFDIVDHQKIVNYLFYPLVEWVIIKKKNSEKSINSFDKRPVINMLICLGNSKVHILVNLANRNEFDYPMLIGREGLVKFHVLVDPNQKDIVENNCVT